MKKLLLSLLFIQIFSFLNFANAQSRPPIQFDYDGDGRGDLSVFRPSNGVWYIESFYLGSQAIQFGMNGDKPVPADYDADGATNIAVFRPSNNSWYIRNRSGEFFDLPFGLPGDIPVPADYDGDRRAEIGRTH